jgi:uncharacterized protein (DUF885 family)
MSISVFDAVLFKALLASIRPDGDARYRSICRWYSKTFFTPLHEVYDLPPEEVLEAHYEEILEDMAPEARAQRLAELLEAPEVKQQKKRVSDVREAEDEEFLQMVRQKAAAEAQRLEAKKQAEPKPVAKESDLPSPQPLPDIHIDFMKGDNLFDEDELGGFAPPPEDKA